MSIVNTVILLTAVLLFADNKIDARGPDVFMKLYFLEFSFITYAPVTMENIETGAHYVVWFTKEHPYIEEVRNTLTVTPTTEEIGRNQIRLKVVFPRDGVSWYVDGNGVAVNTNHQVFKLSQEGMRRLGEIIRPFDGVVDVRALNHVIKHDN